MPRVGADLIYFSDYTTITLSTLGTLGTPSTLGTQGTPSTLGTLATLSNQISDPSHSTGQLFFLCTHFLQQSSISQMVFRVILFGIYFLVERQLQ